MFPRYTAFSLLLLAVPYSAPAARPAGSLNLMPMPAEVVPRDGTLRIGQTIRVDAAGCADRRIPAAVKRTLARLTRQTGMPINPGGLALPARAQLILACRSAGHPVPALEDDESYTLDVTPERARLEAPGPVGILRGIETFHQLVELDGEGFGVPAVRIEDRPRFAWRGVLVDSAHRFVPMENLKRTVDAMAAVKMNVLHLHLSSDYGCRIESKVAPKLHGMGSDGDYYSQDEMRGLIAYAAERGIRILPGLEMPGHIRSWMVGYPELATAPGPYELKRFWGLVPVDATLDVTREAVYPFLDRVLGEMAALFPDRYMHIGGDEVQTGHWLASASVQAFMRDHGLKTPRDLQAYFNGRLEPIVRRHGKTMVGWDEVLHPNLPKTAAVHAWHARKLAEAARQGHPAIMSYGYYLDAMRPAAFHYADPIGADMAGLTREEQARILGGEACLWSEHISPELVDSRLWPRTAAIAERLWSPVSVKDTASMYRRLAAVSRELEELGVRHRSEPAFLLRRLAGGQEIEALGVLASVLEPAGLGGRMRARKYFQYSPLNRLVDAVVPESDVARRFGELVAQESWGDVGKWLVLWRGNHARLLPELERTYLLKEVVPVSRDLETVAAAGLRALEFVQSGGRAPEEWRKQQLALLDAARQPQVEVTLAVVPHVRMLVDRAAARARTGGGAGPD